MKGIAAICCLLWAGAPALAAPVPGGLAKTPQNPLVATLTLQGPVTYDLLRGDLELASSEVRTYCNAGGCPQLADMTDNRWSAVLRNGTNLYFVARNAGNYFTTQIPAGARLSRAGEGDDSHVVAASGPEARPTSIVRYHPTLQSGRTQFNYTGTGDDQRLSGVTMDGSRLALAEARRAEFPGLGAGLDGVQVTIGGQEKTLAAALGEFLDQRVGGDRPRNNYVSIGLVRSGENTIAFVDLFQRSEDGRTTTRVGQVRFTLSSSGAASLNRERYSLPEGWTLANNG